MGLNSVIHVAFPPADYLLVDLHNRAGTVKFSAHGIIFEREKISRYCKREILHLGGTNRGLGQNQHHQLSL